MKYILYHNLNPKAKIRFKRFPNTPEGLENLGWLILHKHYYPWCEMHNQKSTPGFESFFFRELNLMGLKWLKLDETFFDYRLTEID